MNDDSKLDFIRRQLKLALPPLGEVELKADLWPQMLRRLDEAPVRFGWFESVLAGLVALTFAIYPRAILTMLYNL
jgi:hypothetical protein